MAISGYRHERKFVTAWADCVKQIAIPSQVIKGPSSFSLKLNVPEGKAYDVFVFNCQFAEWQTVESLGPAVLPLCVSRGHGMLQAKRVAGQDSPMLSTKADLFETLARDFDAGTNIDTSTGEYVFVPRGNRIGEVILSDGSTRAFPDEDLPPCLALLGTALWSYFPGTAHLEVGAKWEIPAWEIPASMGAAYAWPCEVVGFARMAGKDTAVISCHVEQQEFQGSRLFEVAVGTSDGKTTKVEKVEKTKCKCRDTFHLTAHLDLESGLPVRQEWRLRVEYQTADSGVHSMLGFNVSRILDA
jgi:hypothetical protein